MNHDNSGAHLRYLQDGTVRTARVPGPEHAGEPMTPERLTMAIHLMNHEKGGLWPPSDFCDCRQRAEVVWALLHAEVVA